MATAVAHPNGAPHAGAYRDEHVMDTRTSSPLQRTESGGAQSNGHGAGNVNTAAAMNASAEGETYSPDLSGEVSMLSTKLINAINYQTNLDDSLQASRHELETAHKELRRVRAEKKSLDDAITQGVLVRKLEMDRQISKLRAELAQERTMRDAAEKAKKQTEGELENLTSALFEEANTMVSAARKDTEAVEKRNTQLRNQLSDTETLLASQQEQLQDLKMTMEKLEPSGRDSSVPSTPVDRTSHGWESVHAPSTASGSMDAPPDHPLHFAHLLVPKLRMDTSAYNDFAELLASARRILPHSRTASGNQASASQTNLGAPPPPAPTSSSPHLPGAFSFGNSSASSSPANSIYHVAPVVPPLKESKFYKRILTEDLEPTLRLDLAPGLSFLSRRTVTSSILNGTLVVEPFNPSAKFYGPVYACALCGEGRRSEAHLRKHRFRTSESEDAQRYPLCGYCLTRIRASGDFLGFLRMVRDGHWKCDSDEERTGAWEEAVRLRERMFWARIGGGVVPALAAQKTGPSEGEATPSSTMAAMKSDGRPSLGSIPEGPRYSAVNMEAGAQAPDAAAPAPGQEEGGIGRAIMRMSSSAAPATLPEVQAQTQAPIQESEDLKIDVREVGQRSSEDSAPAIARSSSPSTAEALASTRPERLAQLAAAPTPEPAPFEPEQAQAQASEQLQQEAQSAEPQHAPEQQHRNAPAVAPRSPSPPLAAPEQPTVESVPAERTQRTESGNDTDVPAAASPDTPSATAAATATTTDPHIDAKPPSPSIHALKEPSSSSSPPTSPSNPLAVPDSTSAPALLPADPAHADPTPTDAVPTAASPPASPSASPPARFSTPSLGRSPSPPHRSPSPSKRSPSPPALAASPPSPQRSPSPPKQPAPKTAGAGGGGGVMAKIRAMEARSGSPEGEGR